MKKIYVVQKVFTCTFMGLYIDKKDAQKMAKMINGKVIEYNLEDCKCNPVLYNQIIPTA